MKSVISDYSYSPPITSGWQPSVSPSDYEVDTVIDDACRILARILIRVNADGLSHESVNEVDGDE